MASLAAVRGHVPALAGLLSLVSLALVFAAALGAIPDALLPAVGEATLAAVPHVNAAISLLAIAVIGQGWRWIRRGRITRHRYAMVSGFVLFALFLALYLLKVAVAGPSSFEGSGALATVYYAVLAVHMVLAVVCVPLLYYVLLLALSRPAREIPLTRHPRVGRVAATLWLASFVLGLVVYVLLY